MLLIIILLVYINVTIAAIAVIGNFEISLSTDNLGDQSYPNIVIQTVDNRKVVFRTYKTGPSVKVGYSVAYGPQIIDGNHQENEFLMYKTRSQSVRNVYIKEDEVVIEGLIWGFTGSASYTLKFYLSPLSLSQLGIDLQVIPVKGSFNRLFFHYWCDKTETFHGFGVQYSNWNLKGRRVPIIVAEQGIGRGAQPITAILNQFAKGSGGDDLKTYAPKAVYITNKNRAVLYDNEEVYIFL